MEDTKKSKIQETTAEEIADKPYAFRKLSSTDIFPMFKIIGKIGMKEFTAAIDKNVLMELIAGFTAEEVKENEGAEEANANPTSKFMGSFAVNGATVILSVADVIISRLPSCETDIYQLLSQTSNLSVEEIKKLEAAVFFEMVIDFIRKDEFKDFIKVVSKLFK